MVTEDYVSFEVAKLLKEKGFNIPCRSNYRSAYPNNKSPFYHNGPKDFNGREYTNLNSEWYSAPTLQMAMKWLREVHNVFIDISSRFSKNADKDICFSYSCKKLIDTYKSSYEIGDGEWLNYEEACEMAIKYCLEKLI